MGFSMTEKGKKQIKFKPAYAAAIAVAVVAVIIVVYMAASSSATPVVASGDNVSVYYTGTFTNGTVFDSNVGKTPLNFTVGAGQLIPGFDNAVIGMKVGETKNVSLAPGEAYGEVNQSLIVTVPRAQFGNMSISNDMPVSTSTGQRGIITAFTSNSVTVDFNPPLAGKTLNFEIKVIAVHKP